MRQQPPRFKTIEQLESSERRKKITEVALNTLSLGTLMSTEQLATAKRPRKVIHHIARTACAIGIGLSSLIVADGVTGIHEPTKTMLVSEYPSYYSALDRQGLAPTDSIISYELPGFNASSGYIDNLLEPILDKYGTRVLVRYGDDFSVDVVTEKIAEQLKAAESETQRIVLYGHSMGGDTAIRVAAELIEKYRVNPDRFAVILDCSPASNGDVNTEAHQGFINVMDFISSTPIRGGQISRFGFEAVNSMIDGSNFFDAIKFGWEHKDPQLQENRNAVVIAQAHIINDQPPLVHASNILKKYAVPIAFIAPAKPGDDMTLAAGRYRNDGIILNGDANADWRKRFGENLTDYVITKKNLHGIQKRNSSLYVGYIDDFLRAQGINPYQPDIIEETKEGTLYNAITSEIENIGAAGQQPLLDISKHDNAIVPDRGIRPVQHSER